MHPVIKINKLKIPNSFLINNGTILLTDIYQLENGNQIIDTYKKNWHPDDYENRSLVSIEVETRLVGIA